jgi:hypothetical protein
VTAQNRGSPDRARGNINDLDIQANLFEEILTLRKVEI